MGVWGSKLYENDCACDVRDTYREFLQDQSNHHEAYLKAMEQLKAYIGTDEEPILWFALADTQWHLGKLMPEVQEKALNWIEKEGGLSLWTDDGKNGDGWKKTLKKLKLRLESEQPKEKKFRKLLTNPWNIGDVYAYRFSSERSKESGLYGKYIVFHKIADEPWNNRKIYSRVQIYNKVFPQLPTLEAGTLAEILPIDVPNPFPPYEYDHLELNMNAIMMVLGSRDYSEKHFTYIGNQKDTRNMPRYNHSTSLYFWKNMEDGWLCSYYDAWQNFEYELYGEIAHIRERKKKK